MHVRHPDDATQVAGCPHGVRPDDDMVGRVDDLVDLVGIHLGHGAWQPTGTQLVAGWAMVSICWRSRPRARLAAYVLPFGQTVPLVSVVASRPVVGPWFIGRKSGGVGKGAPPEQ